MESVLDATSPNSGGATPRRIVKSLKQPLACVTQLVPLDSGENSRQAHLLTRFPGTSVPSEASVSEVRSELCSVAYEEPGDESTSSFFDPRRMRHGTKGNTSMSRSRASRTVNGSRNRPRRSFRSVSSREVEESFLSYSDEPVFYQCDSEASSGSAATEGSSYSMSYTHISESVPSCSLTVLADPSKSTSTGWANRFRKPNGNATTATTNNNNTGNLNGPSRKGSGSFGSIFGAGGIDPYNGTSLNSHTAQLHGRDTNASQHTAAARNAAAGHRKSAVAAAAATLSPHKPQQESYSSLKSPIEFKNTISPSTELPVAPDDGHELPSAQDTTALPDSMAAAAATAADANEQRQKVQNVKLLERVGRGTFGDVYRAEDCDTGNIIAVKEIVVPHDFTKDVEKQLSALESEIRVMRRLHHPHVVAYLGANREGNSLRIYMEFVGGGTVGSMLERDGAFSEEKTRNYTAQLLEGLEYLHDSHILHRDLKGDNLFVTEQDQLKLGDFGQSKELADTLITQSVQGTPSFMSPEMIACSGYSFEADVWSVGCCVIQMLTGRPPFSNLDNQMAVMFAIISSKIEDQIPQGVSEGAKDFIRMCTKTNIKDRWSATQLRQHPWLLGSVKEPTAVTSGAAALTGAALAAAAASTSATSKAGAGARKAGGAAAAAKRAKESGEAPGKPPRSILLDTAALAKTDAADDARKTSGEATDQYSYEGDTPDNEAGGNTSSNLSSSKTESPAAAAAAADGHHGSQTSHGHHRSTGAAEASASPHMSPSAPSQRSPGGRRPPRGRGGSSHGGGHNGGAIAKDKEKSSSTIAAGEASASEAQGKSTSPPHTALQKPHRPAHAPGGSSPRHRPTLSSGNGETAAAKRRSGSSNPSNNSNNNNASRGVNTPVTTQAGPGFAAAGNPRAASRHNGSALQRGISPGNQTSRATPNATNARARAPATSRPGSNLPRK